MTSNLKVLDKPSKTVEVHWTEKDEGGRESDSMAVFHLGRLSRWSSLKPIDKDKYTSLRLSPQVGKAQSFLLSDTEIKALAELLNDWVREVVEE